MNWKIWCVLAACPAVLASQTPPATILEVDVENFVSYYLDVTDPAKLATSAAPLLAAPGRVFRWQVVLADVVAVNGRPAKGLYAGRSTPLQSTTRLTPGQAIADIGSWGLNDQHVVILDPDGKEIGSIFAIGVGGTAAPPGAPQGAAAHNLTIVGGTGAFLGLRGQWAYKQGLGGTSRSVSMAEDPAYRRINGGSRRRDIAHLIPMTWPEVLSLPTGPAVFHGEDFSPVTAEKPARAGELLAMSVSGLGPVKPNLDPGKAFPAWQAGKEHAVNSPVEVTVNGKAAQVISAIGWPGMNNAYRVDFRVPEGTAAGTATLGLNVAWINGPEVKLPVR